MLGNIDNMMLCKCYNDEHCIIFHYNVYDIYDAEVTMSIHLRQLGFWDRLKNGIKYIFGYRSKFGEFDEFIFTTDDLDKLRNICKHLETIKELEDENDTDKIDKAREYIENIARDLHIGVGNSNFAKMLGNLSIKYDD